MPGCASSASRQKRVAVLADGKPNWLRWAAIVILTMVVVDQLTKTWAVAHLAPNGSIRLIGDFFMLTLVYNEGGAMGSNIGSSTYYLIATIIILPVLLYFLFRHRYERYLVLSLSFITAGAIGNLIDRIRLGKVVDFLDFDFFDLSFFGWLSIKRWWTFNIADACITVAITYLVIRTLMIPPRDTATIQNVEPESTATKPDVSD